MTNENKPKRQKNPTPLDKQAQNVAKQTRRFQRKTDFAKQQGFSSWEAFATAIIDGKWPAENSSKTGAKSA